MIKRNGFTMVEILAVISILAVVGIILTEIFIRTLRGSAKAQVLASIKQNGQAVMDNMDKTIRGTDNVVTACTIPLNGIIVFKGGTYTRFLFILPTSSQNGYIAVDSDSTCGGIYNNSPSISDKNTKSGVSITSGSFTLVRNPGFGDVVAISFQAEPALEISSQNLVDPVLFKTTIELRNK